MPIIIRIKEGVKAIKAIERVARIALRPYFWLRYRKESFQAWLRGKGILSNRNVTFLRNLKQTHEGERCFIVATGPSLTMEDLNLIKDEFSFGMNSCVLALDKTEWIPNIYGIQDEFVYNKIESKLLEEAETKLKDKIFVSNTISSLFNSSEFFHEFFLHYLDHKYDHSKTGEIKFSEDCEIVIFDDYSILFSLMQLAVYMGFKKLYLLGCDCNYNQEKAHFLEHGVKDPFAANAASRLIFVHSKFKEFADAHGVKVVNCTRGGMLEVYPRKTLEEVLSSDNS